MPALSELSEKSPEWADLTARKEGAKTLKRNPGQWLHLGTYGYKGGFTSYTSRGFRHAIRQSGDAWDHYLMWPGFDDED